MSNGFDLDVKAYLSDETTTRLNERVTVSVSADMYRRLEALGKKKNRFIRDLLEKALPLVEKAAQEENRVA